jgi:predicted NBD/HSP70 family sugar kinase
MSVLIDEQPHGVSVDYVRNYNLKLLLDAVKFHGPISRSDLARLVGLSPPTVSSLVGHLLERDLLKEAELESTNIGRPPQLFHYNESAGYVIGVEINYTSIRSSMANLSGKLIHTIEEPRNKYIGVNESIDQCKTIIDRLLSQSGINWDKVLALSVAVPGITDSQNGIVILAKNLYGWYQVPLGRILQETYHIPIIVENDLRCAALGEYAYGAARGQDTFVIVGLREGVGCALMVNGQVLQGHNFMAGEIGYMCANISSIRNTVAKRGYLESYFDMQFIREKVSKALRQGTRSSLDAFTPGEENEITMKDILDHAMQNDELALEVASLIANGLAFTITNITVVCDPELVVLGSDFGIGGEFLISEVRRLVNDQIPFQPEIVLSSLGSNSVLSGALHMAIATAEERILGDLSN